MTKLTLYIKQDCPFCLKALIFLAESQLLNTVEIHNFTNDSEEIDHIRQKIAQVSQETASFPALVIAKDMIMLDSDNIINYLSQKHHIDTEKLTALPIYLEGVFPTYIGMVKKIKQHFPLYFE